VIDDVVREFIVESLETFEQLDQAFVALEKNPEDREIIGKIFRAVHTVKGTGGCLGYFRLEYVSHAAENLLVKLREGEVPATQTRVSALLASVDAMRSMMTAIEQGGTDDDRIDYGELVRTLERAAEEDSGDPMTPRAPVVDLFAHQAEIPAASEHVELPRAAAPSSAGEHAPPAATAASAQPTVGDTRSPDSRLADSSVRVDVGLLDKVMNLVGELVLARNRLLQCAGSAADPALLTASQRINLITSELQEGVMKTRMQPIGSSWGKLPRLVRETSLLCQKLVRLDTEGHATELDRTLLDALRDPLTHILRNSIDHGIERPEERTARGKPPEGRILIRAYHEGGQVTVDVIDDGAGIDPERVRRKAIERGLLSPAEAARLSAREVAELIFRPGFSTAEKVTHVSGRGVGMDAVRANVESVGGTVEVLSQLGQGTTMRIKLPLTLAIIPALVVRARENLYAIPQASLIELLRLDEERQRQVSSIDGAPIYRLRGQLLPLVTLANELGEEPRPPAAVQHVVVLQTEGQRFGLIVDSVADTAEIVVKPLNKMLKGLAVYAGATVMGDGKVALILDIPGLAQRAGVLRTGAQAAARDARHARGPTAGPRAQRLLIVSDAARHPYAIPLDSVARLEEFETRQIESALGAPAVNYRGEILPIVALTDLVGGLSEALTGDTAKVIVFRTAHASIGIAIDRIEDILECELQVDTRTSRTGVRGSAIVSGRVTDILDLPTLVASRLPPMSAERAA
jgi:two-component system chemotaxis sensor kinase CheA